MLPRVMGGALSSRGPFLLVALMAAMLLGAGCGSSSDDGITVETGSLSKAEFIQKADAICKAAQAALVTKFWGFIEKHEKTANAQSFSAKEALLGESIDAVVAPNVEGEIKQISALGAPEDYATEVASFLNVLQERLQKLNEDPGELTRTGTPFVQAGDVAKRAGMKGCAESFGSGGPA